MEVVGIDLGTTNSAIAHIDRDGRPQVLAGLTGEQTVPSVVLFASPLDHVVGEGARRQARLYPDQVCTLVKRRMGDVDWRFVAHGKAWSAPAVSALILKSLLADAAFGTGSGAAPQRAVITVPAYFGDEERRATMLAGTYAGIEVDAVLSEPIAAALSYGFGRLDGAADLSKETPHETVLAYDLGGGTFDATVIELADRRISVLAVEGDHQLGGADWDDRLALHLSAKFCAEHPDAEDPLDDTVGGQDLIIAAEQAKRELSERDRTQVVVSHDGARSVVDVTRAELEEITAPLLRRTVDLTSACLAAASKRGVHKVDRVLLVGGSSRMPMVEKAITAAMGMRPELHDPDLAVARGAAIYGEKLGLERLVLADLNSRGRLRDGGRIEDAAPQDLDDTLRRVAASFGSPVARIRRLVEIHVDTVVSRGFGVLAVDNTGDLAVTWLVHRNQTLPIRVGRSFGTMRDDQSVIEMTVVEQQGQEASNRPWDAKVLVGGAIEGIPPGYAAGAEVRVLFEMGFDGVLHVTAHHVEADIPLNLTAHTGATISQAEVNRELEQVRETRRKEH